MFLAGEAEYVASRPTFNFCGAFMGPSTVVFNGPAYMMAALYEM